jgi:hypothetical protein
MSSVDKQVRQRRLTFDVPRANVPKRTNVTAEHSSPTVRDIANLAQVSTATVSRVLNGKSNVSLQRRQSVKRAIEQAGYTPNLAATRLADLSAVKRRNGKKYDGR